MGVLVYGVQYAIFLWGYGWFHSRWVLGWDFSVNSGLRHSLFWFGSSVFPMGSFGGAGVVT